jgi:hypothetical protein
MFFSGRSESSIPAHNHQDAGSTGLQVVCAWPVSGQYGAGTRIAYYVLVLAALFLRKNKKLRNAAIATVSVMPAVAGIHALVLAAVHADGKMCSRCSDAHS